MKQKRTTLRKDINIHPIEPCPSTCEHLHRAREEQNELLIPTSHLPARIPERTEDGIKIPPSLLLQRGHEGIALPFLVRGPDDGELGCEPLVDVGVVFDGVAEVEDGEFLESCHAESMLGTWVGSNPPFGDPSAAALLLLGCPPNFPSAAAGCGLLLRISLSNNGSVGALTKFSSEAQCCNS